MTFKKTMADLFSASEGAYYKWKREKRPIIALLEKYHNKEELQEFLETGKIEKQELIKDLSLNDLTNLKEMKKQFILDEINKKQQEIEELKTQLNIL